MVGQKHQPFSRCGILESDAAQMQRPTEFKSTPPIFDSKLLPDQSFPEPASASTGQQ